MTARPIVCILLALFVATLTGCNEAGSGGDGREGRSGRGGRPGGERGRGPGGPGGRPAAALPVEVLPVDRRTISSYIETNGTLEAENEVDVVARTSAPVVELKVEEGMAVSKGQLLARLESDEIRARLEIARVDLDEAELAYERAQKLSANDLISREEYEQARSRFESARAEIEGNRIQLGFTEIRAPFEGLVITRYVNFAEQVAANTPLFRLSDFDPLLCPIRIPERDLSRLRVGQSAYLTVEAWPGERFAAEILRISPVIDAGTGTVKVTLQVRSRGRLRPGMFARVFVEIETHDGALVVPRAAMSLESISDAVYVAEGEIASRREVRLGFREGDFVEVLEGLSEGEAVVVVGQDGLSDGAPIRVLGAAGAVAAERAGGDEAAPVAEQRVPPAEGRDGSGGRRPGGAGRPPKDFSKLTPEQLEHVKERMRGRGMSEQEIEDRIEKRRAQSGGESSR